MTTVLIVDDLPENLYYLRCLLASAQFDTINASNGIEALARVKEHPVDLVVSDILMPGMDGFGLCREWHKDPVLRRIPFIFYTATYTDARDAEFAKSLGADDFIVKPIEPRVLMQRIRELMLLCKTESPPTTVAPEIEESPYLQRYNEVLVRKLEEKVLELEQVNRALLLKDLAIATAVSGILFADVEGVVTYANPAMHTLCLPAKRSPLGASLEALLALPADWAEWVERGEGGRQFEARLCCPGEALTVPLLRVSAHRIITPDGEHRGVMLSCIDLSEETRLRTELARAQRLEALSLFAAGVAHDFNNLLMGIFAGLEIEQFSDENAGLREEYRSMALAAFERAKNLTRRLLTFSKGNAGTQRTVNVCQLLDEEILLSLSGSGIQCVKRYNEQAAMVQADPGQLGQVFSNLFVNARQAMNETGTLVVSVERADGEGAASGGLGRAAILVKISDDGPGIAREILSKIFEPYFTTKREGSGLGLATSQAIVQQHGGSIEVESELGHGTTFTVSLPAFDGIAAQSRPLVLDDLRRGSGRILVMDEQVIVQALVQRALERAGYSVVVVSNGEQAILEFDRAATAGAPFDLLIFDITVRGAMGGAQALRLLRQQGHAVPAIASTGYCDDGTVQRLKGSGFAHVLGKPFLVHELLSIVEAITGTDVAQA